MVHRDTRASKRLSSRLQVPADYRGTRIVNNWISLRERGPSPRLRLPVLNLSMILSPKCNVRINLRSMVRRISALTLTG